MMPFASLSAITRAIFAIWGLGLCLLTTVNAIMAISKKRYFLFGLGLVLFAPSYLAWQVIFDFSLIGSEGLAPLSSVLTVLPWGLWLAFMAVLTLDGALLLVYNLHYQRANITPASVKTYLDGIPCGVCVWREGGRVLFANVCINRLAIALTDEPLLNGDHLLQAVGDGIHQVDGVMWRFGVRDIVLRGEKLKEMIATDVTAEYGRTQALEADKAELSRLNKELQAYTLSIDDAVRHQEILQAKINIHDEMNRLMLSTVVAENGDADTLDHIFSLWEQNALLLCMEAESSTEQGWQRVERLAQALHIRLQWQGDVPSLDDKKRSLLVTAAQEALANASKHAEATQLTISLEEDEQGLACHLVSDGKMPAEPVVYRGGLANLARLAAEEGASVSVEVTERFTLTIRWSKT